MERSLRVNPVRPLWTPTSVRTPRRLGSVFSPPKALNLVYLPAAMLTCSLFCFLSPTDFMLLVGALLLSAVAIYLLYTLIFSDAPVRFSSLLVLALSFGYGLGTVNTYFSLERGGIDLAVFLLKDPVVITHGMGGILLSLSILMSLGELAEKPIFGEEFQLQFPPQAGLFIVLGTLVLMVGFKTGAIGFQGGQIGPQSQVSFFTGFVTWLISPLFGITCLMALNGNTKMGRRFFTAMALLQFVLILPTGRRNQIFALFIAFFCLRLGRFRFGWSWTRRIVVGAILGAVLYVTTVGFYYIRLGSFTSHKKDLSLGERISLGIEYFESTRFEDVQKEYSENVQKRSFVLSFVSELQDLSSRLTPGYGLDLYNQAMEAVPRVLNPEKIGGYTEESEANQIFGTTYLDEANSVLTAGAVDFGLLGIVMYPILFSVFGRLSAEFLGQVLPTYVAVFLIIAMVSSYIQPEQDPASYIVTLRNSLLFGNFIWFILALPWFRLRRPE